MCLFLSLYSLVKVVGAWQVFGEVHLAGQILIDHNIIFMLLLQLIMPKQQNIQQLFTKNICTPAPLCRYSISQSCESSTNHTIMQMQNLDYLGLLKVFYPLKLLCIPMCIIIRYHRVCQDTFDVRT